MQPYKLTQILLWCFVVAAMSAQSAQAQQTAPPVQNATIETRIGALDGPTALGSVEALEVDSLGRIYVLESAESRVRVFGPDGSAIDSFGREGSGPGEFKHPVGMAFSPKGHLWVVDPDNARVAVYEGTEFLFHRRILSGFTLAPWPGRFDTHGRFYHYAGDAGAGEFGYSMVQYDSELRPLDTLPIPVPPSPQEYFQNPTERWGIVRAAVPFTPKLIWRLDSEGDYWWAWTARYELFRGLESQEPVIEKPADGVSVTPQERQTAISNLDRFTRRGGRVDVARIPDKKPALRSFFLDDQDRVWVAPEQREEETGRLFEVFTASGELAQMIRLPVEIAISPPPVVRSNKLFAVVRDELDVPYVVVFLFEQW